MASKSIRQARKERTRIMIFSMTAFTFVHLASGFSLGSPYSRRLGSAGSSIERLDHRISARDILGATHNGYPKTK
jgi:hypothetical protein